MNFLTTNRLRSALMAAVAAALVLPAAAQAAPRHYNHIEYYKVEKQLTMISDEQSVELECKSASDYASDGMWRIDHVDQDDDEKVFPGPWVSTADYGEAVQVLAAYNQAFTTAFTTGLVNDGSKYQFDFRKNAVGTAQLKVWITCVSGSTELNKAGGHQHSITLNGTGATTTATETAGSITASGVCGNPTDTVISPSFIWTNGSGRLTMSILNDLSPPSTMDAWNWKFAVADSAGGAQVKVGWRCVQRQIGGPGDHRLIRKLVVGPNPTGPDDPTNPTGVDPGTQTAPFTKIRATCSSHYKGLVGGFDATADPALYFMGMDPRIKSRTFRFLNYSVANQAVTTMLICFNDRTSLNKNN